jgi:hypothetical protein
MWSKMVYNYKLYTFDLKNNLIYYKNQEFWLLDMSLSHINSI